MIGVAGGQCRAPRSGRVSLGQGLWTSSEPHPKTLGMVMRVIIAAALGVVAARAATAPAR